MRFWKRHAGWIDTKISDIPVGGSIAGPRYTGRSNVHLGGMKEARSPHLTASGRSR
jgi:hypothetical protein